jgi:protein involved in polysaccharide export with SLBB domain
MFAVAWLLLAPCLGVRAARAQDTTATAPAQPGGERPVGVLRPGDVVRLIVYRQKELDGEYVIDSRGTIQVPGLAAFQLGGLTPMQAMDRVREAFLVRGTREPDFALLPLIRINVLGEVHQPGLMLVDPGTSLLQLIARAGGPTDRADLAKTRVNRQGRIVRVDLQRALEGSASGAVVLNSNDVVFIPRKGGLTRENVGFWLSFAGIFVTVINLVVTIQRG